MTSTSDIQRRPSKAVAWFRVVAFAEAITWAGLLAGMYFKYVGTPRTEVGVKIFGMAHGLVFIAFVLAALLVGIAVKWSPPVWLLALLASIVPLGSVIFLIWVERTGRLGTRGAAVATGPVAETT